MVLAPTLEPAPAIGLGGGLATVISPVIPTLASSFDICMASLVPTKKKKKIKSMGLQQTKIRHDRV